MTPRNESDLDLAMRRGWASFVNGLSFENNPYRGSENREYAEAWNYGFNLSKSQQHGVVL